MGTAGDKKGSWRDQVVWISSPFTEADIPLDQMKKEKSLQIFYMPVSVPVVPAWILLIASVSFMLDHLVMANGHWRAHNLHARQTHSGSAAHNSKPKTDS